MEVERARRRPTSSSSRRRSPSHGSLGSSNSSRRWTCTLPEQLSYNRQKVPRALMLQTTTAGALVRLRLISLSSHVRARRLPISSPAEANAGLPLRTTPTKAGGIRVTAMEEGGTSAGGPRNANWALAMAMAAVAEGKGNRWMVDSTSRAATPASSSSVAATAEGSPAVKVRAVEQTGLNRESSCFHGHPVSADQL